MDWTLPYRQEEFYFMCLPRADRYGLVAWRADGGGKFNPSIHYGESGDLGGIQPRLSCQVLSDAQDWVEHLIDVEQATALEIHRREQA